MVFGIIGYVNTDDIISYCDSEASKTGLLSGDFRQFCNQLTLLKFAMPATVIAGLSLTGYGIVAKQKTIEKPIEEKTDTQNLTDDYIKMAKRLQEISEKYDHLENKYSKLITYMKRNRIEIPDYMETKLG